MAQNAEYAFNTITKNPGLQLAKASEYRFLKSISVPISYVFFINDLAN